MNNIIQFILVFAAVLGDHTLRAQATSPLVGEQILRTSEKIDQDSSPILLLHSRRIDVSRTDTNLPPIPTKQQLRPISRLLASLPGLEKHTTSSTEAEGNTQRDSDAARDGKKDTNSQINVKGHNLMDPRFGLLTGHLHQLLVSLQPPITAGVQAGMEGVLGAEGGWVCGWLPHSSFLAVGTASAARKLLEIPGVVWVGMPEAGDKLFLDWQHAAQWSPSSTPYNLSDVEGSHLSEDHPLASAQTIPLGSSELGVVVEVSLPPLAPSPGLTPSSRRPTELDLASTSLLLTLATRQWTQGLVNLTGGLARPLPGEETENTRQPPGAPYDHGSSPCARLALPLRGLASSLTWLAEHPLVHFISPRRKTRVGNYNAASIVQSGEVSTSGFWEINNNSHPFWAAGLTGTDQIVGFGDTGVDLQSCYFRDEGGAGVGSAHRKVVMYNRVVNDMQDVNGHGTHVAGSIAGNALGESYIDRYSGMAPEAKLAVHDMEGSTGSGSLSIPSNLGSGYFQISYDVGARIHSDSWGSSSFDYSKNSRDMDEFLYTHQEFLAIFAAGNYGTGSNVRGITSPGTAKNCLTVGASLGPDGTPPFRNGVTFHIKSAAEVEQEGEGSVEPLGRILQAEFGPSFTGVDEVGGGVGLQLVVATPLDACSELTNQDQVAGKVVLVKRAPCYFITKVRIAQSAGAVGVLVVNEGADGYVSMGAPAWDDTSDITIPSGILPESTGEALMARASLFPDEMYVFPVAPPPSERFQNMAAFSSIGPTQDGRLKPEITAPGEAIRSAAHSDTEEPVESCRVSVMSGTSMSTPIVAGAAALVRQYFMDGFYPSGVAGGSSALSPSGALVKAVLLNGASEMTGSTESGLPLEPPPSIRQGFGRLLLSNSLPLVGVESTPAAMHVVDMQLVETGDIFEYCIRVPDSQDGRRRDLRATLVWHDPAALLNSGLQLVNDLDLSLRGYSLDPKLLGGRSELYGNHGQDPDKVNNAERVHVPGVLGGDYVVVVKGVSITTRPQRFALVVTGPLEAVRSCEGAVVTSGPQLPLGRDQPAAFTFQLHSDQVEGVGVECQLSNTTSRSTQAHSWEACEGGARSYSNLEDGAFVFAVRSQTEDAASVPDEHWFVVDTTPPVTELRSDLGSFPQPASLVDRAEFYFSARGENTLPISYHCLLHPLHDWQPCSSPRVYQAMLPGMYNFSVRAEDGAGNVDSNPPSYQWVMEAGTLNTYITSPPINVSESAKVSFTFSTDPEEASEAEFQCQLVRVPSSPASQPPFQPCSSPVVYTNQPDGRFQFSVRTVIGDTLEDFTPATEEFRIDTGAPVVVITSAPGSLTSQTSLSFHFKADCQESTGGDSLNCQFHCSLDDFITGTVIQSGICRSPMVYVSGWQVFDGHYLFRVFAQEGPHQGVEATHSFLVDRQPPTSNISSVNSPTAVVTVHFYSNDGPLGSGVAVNRCFITGSSAWTTCTSPVVYTRRMPGECVPETRDPPESNVGCLDDGVYEFSVMAIDFAGNEGSISRTTIVVDSQVPTVAITAMEEPGSGDLGPQQVRFQVTASDEGASASGSEGASSSSLEALECQLAKNDFTTPKPLHDFRECSGVVKYSNLPFGEIVFTVRAMDTAGNTGVDSRTIIVRDPSSDDSVAGMFGSLIFILILVACAALITGACLICIYVKTSKRFQKKPPGRPSQGSLRVEEGGEGGHFGSSTSLPPSIMPPMFALPTPARSYRSGHSGTESTHTPGRTMVKCPICDGMVAGVDALNLHLDVIHMIRSQEPLPPTAATTASPGLQQQQQQYPSNGVLSSLSAEDSSGVSVISPSPIHQPHASPPGRVRRDRRQVDCPVCGVTFPSVDHLNVHLDQEHEINRPSPPRNHATDAPTMIAPIVGSPLPGSDPRVVVGSSTVQCPVCSADCASVQELNLHLDAAHNLDADSQDPSPPIPPTTSPAPAEMPHSQTFPDTPFVYSANPAPRVRPPAVEPATPSNPQEQPRRSSVPVQCPICSLMCDTNQLLNDHIDSAHGFDQGGDSGEPIPAAATLAVPVENSAVPVESPHEGNQAVTTAFSPPDGIEGSVTAPTEGGSLIIPQIAHTDSNGPSHEEVGCPICNHLCATVQDLNTHLDNEHGFAAPGTTSEQSASPPDEFESATGSIVSNLTNEAVDETMVKQPSNAS